MATFAKSTFNPAIYALARPTYPAELFDYVFAFHRQGSRLHPARWERAVDLGCGTGEHLIDHGRPVNNGCWLKKITIRPSDDAFASFWWSGWYWSIERDAGQSSRLRFSKLGIETKVPCLRVCAGFVRRPESCLVWWKCGLAGRRYVYGNQSITHLNWAILIFFQHNHVIGSIGTKCGMKQAGCYDLEEALHSGSVSYDLPR